MVTQELGDPFRRDALKKLVRLLEKYREYPRRVENAQVVRFRTVGRTSPPYQ